MRILTDEGLPAATKGTLTALAHQCETVRKAGSGAKKNGELLRIAEGRRDVRLTSDRNINYQQNMTGLNVSIVILCAKSNRMKDQLPLIPACSQALFSLQPGQVVEVGPLQARGSDEIELRQTSGSKEEDPRLGGFFFWRD